MNEAKELILLMYEIIQSVLMVYFVFLIYKWGFKSYAYIFMALAIFFTCLKFQFVPYETGSYADRFLWGTYNTAYVCLLILFFSKLKHK